MSDDLLARAEAVKARWPMDAVVEQLIGEPVPYDRKINSPFNEADETPSFHVYEDHFYDYSTGRYGDVITLIQALRKCSFPEAVELLESEADELGLVAVERVVVERPKFVTPENIIYSSPETSDTPGCLRRIEGVTDYMKRMLWQAISVGKTVDDGLAIVHRHNGEKVVGIKYRHGDGKKTAEPGSDFTSYLYQPFWYPAGADTCVITEGETDSWAWLSCRPNDHVYALPAGAATWRKAFVDQLEAYERVYLAFDNDKAGQHALEKITREVGWGRAEHVQIPPLYKDVREAVVAGWKPLAHGSVLHSTVLQ